MPDQHKLPINPMDIILVFNLFVVISAFLRNMIKCLIITWICKSRMFKSSSKQKKEICNFSPKLFDKWMLKVENFYHVGFSFLESTDDGKTTEKCWIKPFTK